MDQPSQRRKEKSSFQEGGTRKLNGKRGEGKLAEGKIPKIATTLTTSLAARNRKE